MVFNHSHMGKSLYLCPPREYFFFGVDPVGVRFFFSPALSSEPVN